MPKVPLITTGQRTPRFAVSKSWQVLMEGAVGELQEEGWGDPKRQIIGLKDRMRDQETFQKNMDRLQIKINGVILGLGIQFFAFLVWAAYAMGWFPPVP